MWTRWPITWTQTYTYMHIHAHTLYEQRYTHICMYILIHHMNTGTRIYACTYSYITWTQTYAYMHVHTHCIVPRVHKHTQTQLKMNSKLKIWKFWCERVNAKLNPWIQQLYQNEVTKKKSPWLWGESEPCACEGELRMSSSFSCYPVWTTRILT